MKNALLPVFCLLLFLGSCSTYEYCRIDADGMKKNDSSELVWENDTVKLTYNFHGENAPLTLSIYNKLSKPLFVNWKESALIREGQSISLYDAHFELIRGKYTSSLLLTRSVPNNASDLSASFSLPEGIDIIAPDSYISKGLFPVWDGKKIWDPFGADSLPAEHVSSAEGELLDYKTRSYGGQESPAHFRVYLTFGASNMAGAAFSITQPFYITQVMRASYGPEKFALFGWKGDLFYFKEKGQ